MSVRLVIESAPHSQAVTERVFDGGRLVIGRSDDADWPLNDPDMFISRQHCILTEKDGRVMAMDASSGGLFVDNAANPVGTSNAVPIEPGMRLRMGDFVFRVEAVSGPVTAPGPAPGRMSFEFGLAPDEQVPPTPAERPKDLPDPFGLAASGPSRERRREPAQPRPLDQHDPFALDLRKAFAAPDDAPSARDTDPAPAGGGYFGGPAAKAADTFSAPSAPSAAKPDLFAGWSQPVVEPAPDEPVEAAPLFPVTATPTPAVPTPAVPKIAAPEITGPETAGPRPAAFEAIAPEPVVTQPARQPEPQPAPRPAPVLEPDPIPRPAAPEPTPAEAPLTATDRDLYAALLRGMGLDPAQIGGDPIQQAEQIGRSMRLLTEGVMLLLRSRAEAKQKARVAQTIIASADVNPLKFLASPEDVLASFVAPRGRGYLGADAAVQEAFRDLTDHHLRTWTALQAALRLMIDRFDPDEIEKAMENVGLLESLIAGGRSAKLWRLYQARYREIAKAAEDRFLGEVGADFRDAYEDERRRRDDHSNA